MPRKLTNKQRVVLGLLREHGECSAKEVAKLVEENVQCAACGGSGEGDDVISREYTDRTYRNLRDVHGCGRCRGRGHVWLGYSGAYQALSALRRRGLVGRRVALDQFGDELPRHVYFAEPQKDPDDPLEQLFNAPSAEVDR